MHAPLLERIRPYLVIVLWCLTPIERGVVMSVEWALRVREGMLVVDNASDRVGPVKAVHSDERLSDGTADYLEVRSGLLGWGKDLYIPVAAISDISADAVYLAGIYSPAQLR